MIRVVEIQSEEGLRELKGSWSELLRHCASDTVFLTWEWLTSWWSAYGIPGELRILAAFDEGDVLRGLAPLRCGTLQRYHQSAPALTLMGDGSNDSDYLDFIVASGF